MIGTGYKSWLLEVFVIGLCVLTIGLLAQNVRLSHRIGRLENVGADNAHDVPLMDVRVRAQLDEHDSRLDSLDSKRRSIESKVNDVASKCDDIESRVTHLEIWSK